MNSTRRKLKKIFSYSILIPLKALPMKRKSRPKARRN